MDMDNVKKDSPIIKERKIKAKETDAFKSTSIFWEASPEALFRQEIIAEVIGKSIRTLARERWLGTGIPYRKLGARVLYRKSDVIAYIEGHELIKSEPG